MKIKQWLQNNTKRLQAAGITTARLDALVLLEDALAKDRAWILANEDEPLSVKVASQLQKAIERRENHEPLAYIRGKSEFYGREFIVTPATLQPRPETETMIELFKNISDHLSPHASAQPSDLRKEMAVVDVGTGSGCIAITAKLEKPEAEVFAIDINKDTLTVAKQNAKRLGADVQFYQGNLLEPLLVLQPSPLTRPAVIMANLPYVPDKYTINEAAMQEPKVAIFGGEDGLDLYREMFSHLTRFSDHTSVIMTESLPYQHQTLAGIAADAGCQLVQTDDFIQVFRPA